MYLSITNLSLTPDKLNNLLKNRTIIYGLHTMIVQVIAPVQLSSPEFYFL